MSSSVFFRFKSQKEPSRVAFDGTGISVFELKREIITMNRLGDGTDFELIISSEDNNEEYDDDTAIIPRSTTVIAKRLPASKPGRGGAARYVSGKMPLNAKNSHRTETSQSKTSKNQSLNVSNGLSDLTALQTEEERIAAMFRLGADQWEQQQQEMAHATPIHRGGPMKGKSINVPDRPPPAGYICYRCGEKGHWIQVCPTNDDPNFDGRPRVKRTTGIPRSFLKTVEKPAALTNDGTTDESKYPSGIMVNAEGEWVIAEPDQASWEQYQAKARVSAAAQEAAARGSKELQDRGLECSIDKRLFVEPTKTPCCKMTYCNECITNALLDNGLQCPGCSTEGILIDDLVPDDDMVGKVRSYEDEQATTIKEKEKTKSPVMKQEGGPPTAQQNSKSQSPVAALKHSTSTAVPFMNGNSRKRPAESELDNNRMPPAPRGGSSSTIPTGNGVQQPATTQASTLPMDMSLFNQYPFTNGNLMPLQGMNAMSFPNTNAFIGMPMSVAPMMSMNAGMMNPMMMQAGSYMGGNGNNWNNMGGMGFPQQSAAMYGTASFPGSIIPNGGYGQASMQMPMGNGFMGMDSAGSSLQSMGSFANQQRTTFSAPRPSEEDSAYFRKPVNPHRHQGRRNVNRPTDYREI